MSGERDRNSIEEMEKEKMNWRMEERSQVCATDIGIIQYSVKLKYITE